jgi:hypothetical protein
MSAWHKTSGETLKQPRSCIMDLGRIAEWCESATGAWYEIDCAIHDAVHPGERQKRWTDELAAMPTSMSANLGPADMDGHIKPWHAYTANFEGALRLVPHNYYARAIGQCDEGWFAELYEHGPRTGIKTGTAKSAALALCAAALRARQL